MIEPSLREKKRYYVIETLNKSRYPEVKDNLYKTALEFLGEKGTGELGLIFLNEHWNGKKGIIRVSIKKGNEFKTVLGLMSLKTKTIKTTGSLIKSKKYMKEE